LTKNYLICVTLFVASTMFHRQTYAASILTFISSILLFCSAFAPQHFRPRPPSKHILLRSACWPRLIGPCCKACSFGVFLHMVARLPLAIAKCLFLCKLPSRSQLLSSFIPSPEHFSAAVLAYPLLLRLEFYLAPTSLSFYPELRSRRDWPLACPQQHRRG